MCTNACAHLCVCALVLMRAHVEIRGWCCIFLNCSPHFLRQGLSLNLEFELTNWRDLLPPHLAHDGTVLTLQKKNYHVIIWVNLKKNIMLNEWSHKSYTIWVYLYKTPRKVAQSYSDGKSVIPLGLEWSEEKGKWKKTWMGRQNILYHDGVWVTQG